MKPSRDTRGPTAVCYRLLARVAIESASSVAAQSEIDAKDNSALLAASYAPTTLTLFSRSTAPRAHFALIIGIRGN